MDVLEQPTIVFVLALAMALVIERVTEILKVAWDLAEARFGGADYWTRRAMKIRDALEARVLADGAVRPEAAARILTRFDEMILGEDARDPTTVPVLCGDLVRAVHVRAVTRLLSIGLGLWAAFALGIDLVARAAPFLGSTLDLPSWAGPAATGVAIGLGSALVHKAIGEIERRRPAPTPAKEAA